MWNQRLLIIWNMLLEGNDLMRFFYFVMSTTDEGVSSNGRGTWVTVSYSWYTVIGRNYSKMCAPPKKNRHEHSLEMWPKSLKTQQAQLVTMTLKCHQVAAKANQCSESTQSVFSPAAAIACLTTLCDSPVHLATASFATPFDFPTIENVWSLQIL